MGYYHTTEKTKALENRVLEKSQADCLDVKELLFEYSEGELSFIVINKLDAHIAACQHCKDEVDSYLMVKHVAKELPAINVDSAIKVRLRQALNDRLGLRL